MTLDDHGWGATVPLRVNDHRAHVRLDGPADGPVWAFANALGTDLRVWAPLLPRLEARHFVRYDKRGHGLSELTPGPYTMDRLADDLAGVLDAVGAERAVVVGLSIGGLVAQSLAARRPDLVQALVLMDTAPKIGTAEVWNERIAAVAEGGIERLADGTMERWFAPSFREGRPEEVGFWRTMLTRTPPAGWVACAEAVRDADLTDAAARIAVPTLCLGGAHDGSTPPDLVRAMAARIPNAEFELIEDAGHLPNVEKPAAVAARLERFAQEHGLDRR